nr:hypothetical protein [Mesorhizobium sp.]
MTGHVHFDVAEAERQLRAGRARAFEAAIDGVVDPDTRAFLMLQHDLLETEISAALWLIRSRNAGAVHVMAANALGAALGQIMFMAEMNLRGDSIADIVATVTAQTVEDCREHMAGGTPEGCSFGKSTIVSKPGGRA